MDAKTGVSPLACNASAATTPRRPCYADGRIYFQSEEGKTIVITPGRTFQRLAENQLNGSTLASIGVSDGSLYIRSDSHLYRLATR